MQKIQEFRRFLKRKTGVQRLQSFIGFTLLGGFMVVLPFVIFLFLLEWLFKFITGLISPLSRWLASVTPLAEYMADILAIIMVLGIFFVIGLAIKTNVGRLLHERLDAWLTKVAPGYQTIREIISQLLGGEGNASLLKGQVCRAYIMGRAAGVSVTGIVTAIHDNGDYTVYVATAPIPTSGFVYHLSPECVDLLPHISVETAMRTVIACGSGSQILSEPPPLETPLVAEEKQQE
jgi:Uncharacterized conserved protein